MGSEDYEKLFRRWLFIENAYEFETYFKNGPDWVNISVDDVHRTCSFRLGPFYRGGSYLADNTDLSALGSFLFHTWKNKVSLRQFFMAYFWESIKIEIVSGDPKKAGEYMLFLSRLMGEFSVSPPDNFAIAPPKPIWMPCASREAPTHTGQYLVKIEMRGDERWYQGFEPIRLAKYDVEEGEWDIPLYYDDFTYGRSSGFRMLAWRELPKDFH